MSDDNITITLDSDKKCAECGKGFAAPSGLCMRCTGKAVSGKPMLSSTAQAVQRRALGKISMPRTR